jgi:hypothetical protein
MRQFAKVFNMYHLVIIIAKILAFKELHTPSLVSFIASLAVQIYAEFIAEWKLIK